MESFLHAIRTVFGVKWRRSQRVQMRSRMENSTRAAGSPIRATAMHNSFLTTLCSISTLAFHTGSKRNSKKTAGKLGKFLGS
jgi:hypothetical protein